MCLKLFNFSFPTIEGKNNLLPVRFLGLGFSNLLIYSIQVESFSKHFFDWRMKNSAFYQENFVLSEPVSVVENIINISS